MSNKERFLINYMVKEKKDKHNKMKDENGKRLSKIRRKNIIGKLEIRQLQKKKNSQILTE